MMKLWTAEKSVSLFQFYFVYQRVEEFCLMGRVLCFYKYITQDHTKSDVNKHGALAGIHRRLSIHFGVCGVLAQVPAS